MELLIIGLLLVALAARRPAPVTRDDEIRELEWRLSRVEGFLNQLYLQLRPRGTNR
jgi:hypothetical protein